MSTIAKKLCDDIVEPAFKQISTETTREKPYTNSSNRHNSNVTRSVIVEKKKVINKLIPRDASTKTIVNQYKHKDILSNKEFTDVAVNTLISGALRCDNNCVTMVRRRHLNRSCFRCGQKYLNSKAVEKQVQTLGNYCKIFSISDKACMQCVDTVSCGTQFLKRMPGTDENEFSLERVLSKDITTDLNCRPVKRKVQRKIQQFSSNLNMPSNMSYMGARRWALSKYPTKGPDF